ncbi:hypothetical protein [Methanobacterium sp.]|uniref:hypothetical protein n=1 Tax=Methanobacterium sp. TaxID=2164 RepID=UPI003C74980F
MNILNLEWQLLTLWIEKVNPESIAVELKSLFDNHEMGEREYNYGLKELNKIKKGV